MRNPGGTFPFQPVSSMFDRSPPARVSESSIWMVLNPLSHPGENSVACSHLIISACMGLALISY